MKKKFLAVVGSAAVAAAFWACGSGEIYEPTDNDRIYQDQAAKQGSSIFCPDGCDGAFAVESSSSAAASEVTDDDPPDIGDIDDIQWASSTSGDDSGFELNSSESQGGSTEPGVLGKCAPAVSPINMTGGSAKYTFTANNTTSGYSPQDFLKANFTWNFGAKATNATAKGMSPSGITFTQPGKVNAVVTVTMADGYSADIACEPLNVNSTLISGCACTAEATSVDYTSAEPTWSVSGCTTTATSKSLTYAWDGGAPSAVASFSKAFAAAQSGWAPVLRVADADSSEIIVSCDLVKTTKGAEYTFTELRTKVALPEGVSNVLLDLPDGWHGDGNPGTCTLRCDDAGQPVTITVGSESSKADYSATLSLPVSKTVNKTSLAIGLSAAAKCAIEY